MSSTPLPDVADPLAEARIQLSDVTADAPRAVAIIGAGLGYLTEAARERWPDAVLVVLEAVYSVTDPPIRAFRRVFPPLRIGSISLDLSFLAVLLLCYLLLAVTTVVFF